MASIIQIKRGTGSAVPSGLADGELAINLDNGRLYFGSGSTSVNDFTFNNITVNQLTSSIVTSSIIHSSGSNIFGDALDDTHLFRGHITSSGNISASGDLIANNITASNLDVDGVTNLDVVDIDGQVNFGDRVDLGQEGSGTQMILYSNTSGKNAQWSSVYNMLHLNDHTYLSFGTLAGPGRGDMNFYYNGSKLVLEDFIGDNILHISSSDTAQLIVDGHITSSGNISASGTITAEHITSTDDMTVTDDLTVSGDINANGNIVGDDATNITNIATIECDSVTHDGDTDTKMAFGTDAIRFTAGNVIVSDLNSVSVKFNLPVTASSHISSSGNVLADRVFLQNNDVLRYSSANLGLYVNGGIQTIGDSTFGNGDTDIHKFNGAITASGNISSSGTIIANQLEADLLVSRVGDANTGLQFASDTVVIQGNDESIATFATNRIEFTEHITASGNISSSGTITANSFAGAATSVANALTVDNATLQLDSGTTFDGSAARTISVKDGGIDSDALAQNLILVDGGNNVIVQGSSETAFKIFSTHAATNRDVGLTLSASSNGQEYTLGLNRANNSFVIAPSDVNNAPGNSVFELDATGHITASGNISASGTITGQAGLTQHSITGTTAGEAKGDIVKFGGTTSMTAGAIYHYNASSNWELADADDNTKSDGLLGVALGASSDADGVLLRGMVTLDHDPGTVGEPLYLTTTAGDVSSTAPSGNGNIVRIVGYCLNSSNNQIWFNPDSTFVEVNA